MQKHVKDKIIFVDKPKMSIVPLVLSAASLFFVVLGAASLFYLQPRLQEPQIIDDQASIGGGTVILTSELTSAPTFTQGAPSTIDLKFNSQGVQLSGIQIRVRVTTDSETPTIEVAESAGLDAIYQEVEKLSDGYLISMIISAKNISDTFSSTSPKTFARLSIPLTAPGEIKLGYDRPNSIATVADATENVDQLRTPVDATFAIAAATASVAPSVAPSIAPTPAASPIVTGDDFYPIADRLNVTYVTDDASRTPVALANLRAYQKYRAIIQYTIQNIKKNEAVNLTQLMQSFVINGQGSSFTTDQLTMHLVAAHRDGGGDSAEVPFTALPNNELRVTTDANNSFLEINEGNNSVVYKFSASVPAATPTPKSCNQECANSKECGSGFTCFTNRCRRPDNPDNTSCSAPTAAVSKSITEGCGLGCTTSKNCANNLRCYNGACRLATNPSSFSCAAVTKPVITQPIGGVGYVPTPAQPSKGDEIPLPAEPSASPAAGASTRPTATPSVRPSGSPLTNSSPIPFVDNNTGEPTSGTGNGAFASVMEFFRSRGISLPIIAVGLGLILFLIALILALMNSGRRRPPVVLKKTEPPVTPAEDELQRKINALKSGPQAGPRIQAAAKPAAPVVAAPVTQAATAAPTPRPQTVMITKPAAGAPQPTPQAAPPAPAAQQPQAGNQTSMMSRLKDRGVMDTVGKTKTD